MAAPFRALRASPRRAIRTAVWLWLSFSIVTWNVVFDYEIRMAGRRYVVQQAMHEHGRAPAVTIPGIMRPAAGHGAKVATVWALLILSLGVAGLGLDRRLSR
jgi:hypothetical protein